MIINKNQISIATKPCKWFAIYTRSNFEKKLYADLLKAKYEVFLPLIKETRLWSDRMKTILVPLLPSYVFVKMEEQQLSKLYNYAGIVRLVSSGGKPCEIKEEEILFMDNIVKHGFPVCPTDGYVAGDSVRVVRGPLKGWAGKIEMVKGKSRIAFRIESLQQCLSVEVSMGDVEKIK